MSIGEHRTHEFSSNNILVIGYYITTRVFVGLTCPNYGIIIELNLNY